MPRHKTVWSFETASLRVELRISDCIDDPADSFDDDKAIEDIRSGAVAWFDAAVVVLDSEGNELGWDSLGGCAYEPASDFWTAHRDPDPMNRNCSIMREARGQVTLCHYFPGMVREALAAARATLAKHASIRLRAA